MTIWRCPTCGRQDIEVTGLQTYQVERYILDGQTIDQHAEPSPQADELQVTLVECQSCGEWSEDDEYWHMTENEWRREQLADDADTARDLRMDR